MGRDFTTLKNNEERVYWNLVHRERVFRDDLEKILVSRSSSPRQNLSFWYCHIRKAWQCPVPSPTERVIMLCTLEVMTFSSWHLSPAHTWNLTTGSWILKPESWPPETWHLEPGTSDLEPDTWYLDPELLKPAPSNLIPETSFLKPGHLEPLTCNLIPDAWHLEPVRRKDSLYFLPNRMRFLRPTKSRDDLLLIYENFQSPNLEYTYLEPGTNFSIK